MIKDESIGIGTGRRKTAVARVRLRHGMGQVLVNHRKYVDDKPEGGRVPFAEVYPGEFFEAVLKSPFVAIERMDLFEKVNILINPKGGGLQAQVEAIRLGIARALLDYNESFRPALKNAGLLTRDSRMKERMKPGQPGARKKFQFSKR